MVCNLTIRRPPALDGDGSLRDGAELPELTGYHDPARRPCSRRHPADLPPGAPAPRRAKEKMAFRNAEELFGMKV